MSVIVGFSQPTTPLLAPAAGTTKPDGTPADGSTEGAGDANLFAALLAMLTPGAQQPADATDATAPDTTVGTIAPPTGPVLPPALPAEATAETGIPPELAALSKSEQGKALFKDFAAALKAAKQALDDGKPLDPALEKKLTDSVDAIAAWFSGQPPLRPIEIDASMISKLADGGANLLTIAPSDLPAPTGTDTVPAATDATTSGATDEASVTPKTVEAKPVPDTLAKLGDALKDIASELETASPELAKALGKLADRIAVGDIADDVLAQLGLQRTPDSSTPDLDQLVAALTAAKPDAKPATAPQSPIAAPTLALPETIARPAATETKSEPGKAEKLDSPARPDDVQLEAKVKLDPKSDKHDDKPAADSKPTPAAPARTDAPDPTPAATPSADASAQAAPAAATAASTATRAIHAAYAAPVQQLNVPQVAFEVARQFEAGNTRFQIRLDPAELGRIDVKLDLDKHGTVNAHMVVERPETLDLMLRDQRALQQALQQAGIDTGKTNLEFSLRKNPFAGADANAGQGGGNGQPGFGPFGAPVADESTELAAQSLYRGTASAGGVNLFV